MQPTSDDELQLMQDVELLHSQLRTVGEPVDESFANLFVQSLQDKLLGVRYRKWQLRKIHFEKLLQNANSGAAAAADSADRARAQRPIPQTEHCAADSAPPPNSGAAADSAAPPENAPQMKPRISLSGRPASASAYAKRTDGKALEMAQIHVFFAKLSAAHLVRDCALRMEDLMHKFNADWPTIAPTFGLETCGKANNFFVNGYFTMKDLKAMAKGDALFPIPMSGGPAATPAQRRQPRDGGDAENPPSPAPAIINWVPTGYQLGSSSH